MSPNRTVKTIALGAALVVAGILLGFGAAGVVIGISNAILPPFRPEDDDTLREFIPVAMAYLAWGVTTVVVVLADWRWIGRRR